MAIDKKGYDDIMRQINEELAVDKVEINQKLNEKYANYQYFGDTAEADKKKMDEQRKADFEKQFAKRKKLREKVHFTLLGGKKKVLKEILNNDFNTADGKPKTQVKQKEKSSEKPKTISVSKAEIEKKKPFLPERQKRIETTKAKMTEVKGVQSSFQKDKSKDERPR